MEKMNIVKDLKKLFSLKTDDEKTKISPDNYKGYMDASNVCMLVPKSKEFEKILLDNFDVRESKIPIMNYSEHISNPESTSTFSTEYLMILLTLCKHYERVTLSVKHDFPLRAETEDFIFILAPRVDN